MAVHPLISCYDPSIHCKEPIYSEKSLAVELCRGWGGGGGGVANTVQAGTAELRAALYSVGSLPWLILQFNAERWGLHDLHFLRRPGNLHPFLSCYDPTLHCVQVG